MRKPHWGDRLCISGRIMVPIPIPVVLQMLQLAHLITGHLFALSVFFLIISLASVRIQPWKWEFEVTFSSGYYVFFFLSNALEKSNKIKKLTESLEFKCE